MHFKSETWLVRNSSVMPSLYFSKKLGWLNSSFPSLKITIVFGGPTHSRKGKKVFFWSALSLFCVWSKYKKQSRNNLPTPSNKHQLDIKHLEEEKSWFFWFGFSGQSVLKWCQEKTWDADRTGQSVQSKLQISYYKKLEKNSRAIYIVFVRIV